MCCIIRNEVTELAQKITPKIETSIWIIESFSVMSLRNLVVFINKVTQRQDATDIREMGVNKCCQYLYIKIYLILSHCSLIFSECECLLGDILYLL